MFRYTRYLGPEKLKRAIWCELFVIREGYLPYLKKWAKLQDQADPDDNKICNDLQHLAPGGPPKVSDLQELAKSDDTTHPLGDKN